MAANAAGAAGYVILAVTGFQAIIILRYTVAAVIIHVTYINALAATAHAATALLVVLRTLHHIVAQTVVGAIRICFVMLRIGCGMCFGL